MTVPLASWIELSEVALKANTRAFREIVGPSRAVGLVAKGNAYGHGLAALLPALHAASDVLFVILAEEALRVRAFEAATGCPRREVLVIGAVTPAEAAELARHDVAVVLADTGFAAVARALVGGPPLKVHVHLDTGLSREGFLPETLEAGLAFLDRCGPEVVVAGVLTHFADTEDVTEQDWALHQLAAFDDGCARLTALLARLGRPTALVRHTAASAAALALPASRHDVVRIGIAAYGLWPSRETRISARNVLGRVPVLEPVLSWRCPSQVVKRIPAGSYVGYGCTHRCADDTTIAVLPVGYWDGYPRLLSGRAHVLVQGRRCAVLGRVMMNHIVIDVTGVQDHGERVVATLLGRDGGETVSAEDLAGWAQTIHYEIVTRLGAHLRRVVLPGA